ALEGRVFNRNVAADRLLTNAHLLPHTNAEIDAETVLLEMETTESGIHIALAARTGCSGTSGPSSRFGAYSPRPRAGWPTTST
ncbi:MAG: hypothetical protein LH624_09325, partial [Cryobacterium sp.]|nr:hypothetical protein [Cryobacterium sp.]